MTPGQTFILLLVFLFCFAAYTTVRDGMTPYYAMMTAVLWLGVGVGFFIKIGLGVWK
jgi:hypothetical protein